MRQFTLPSSATKFRARAKYIPQPDGSLRLALVQCFSRPNFRMSGWEDRLTKAQKDNLLDDLEGSSKKPVQGLASDIERATRRARINAFDIIQCNFDMNVFCTFTYAPDAIEDRWCWGEAYDKLAVWLSNRVQRRGLKYVLVPERHKSGAIHFHAIMNLDALELVKARNPSGRLIYHNGRTVYNITDWPYGYTTAEIIGETTGDRDAVSKYVFKYMGKQLGYKVGGRYALTGGKLVRPVYAYGETADEFLGGSIVKYDRTVQIGDDLEYKEYSLV